MDRGIDGYLHFRDADKQSQFAIVSVKGGGNVSVNMIRDLHSAMEREKAPIGVFICAGLPTRRVEATPQPRGTRRANQISRTTGQVRRNTNIITCRVS